MLLVVADRVKADAFRFFKLLPIQNLSGGVSRHCYCSGNTLRMTWQMMCWQVVDDVANYHVTSRLGREGWLALGKLTDHLCMGRLSALALYIVHPTFIVFHLVFLHRSPTTCYEHQSSSRLVSPTSSDLLVGTGFTSWTRSSWFISIPVILPSPRTRSSFSYDSYLVTAP